AASIRMQALTEMRIRRVLTPEQIRTLKELRALAQQMRRGQRLETRANDTRSQPNQGNGLMPPHPPPHPPPPPPPHPPNSAPAAPAHSKRDWYRYRQPPHTSNDKRLGLLTIALDALCSFCA